MIFSKIKKNCLSLSPKQKVLTLTLCALVFFGGFYLLVNQRLTSYSCSSSVNAEACFRCKPSSDGEKVDFLVNKNNQTVMKRMFVKIKGQSIVTSSLLEKCKIFDEKNWDCSEGERIGRGFFYTHDVMVDGVFSHYTQINHEDSGSAWCAK